MRIPIRTRITLLAIPVVSLTIVSSALFSIYYFRSNIITATEYQVAAVGRTIQTNVENSLALGFNIEDLAGVNERLGYIASSYREISSVYVTNVDDKILFHSDPSKIGGIISYSGDKGVQRLDDGSYARPILSDKALHYEVSIDIYKNGVFTGKLKLDIPESIIAEKTLPMIEVFILVATLSLFAAVAAAYAIGRRISKPITELERAAMAMAKGNFSERAERLSDDEIGDLSITFNWMAEEIKKSQEKLQQNIVELKNLLELKTEFLHIIDHQLRTPLSVMRGYLEFWRTGQYQKFPLKKQEEIKHKIITATDQLSSIIHSMIDALEVEGGSLDVKASSFDLKELIREIYEVDFADKYNNKGIKLTLDVDKAPQMFSDKQYVSAVITNLMDNALKYTPTGEVNVKAYFDGQNAMMEFADTGIGLSDNDMGGLFHKFVRGEEAPKASPTGSGIGLYIVRQLLDALHGSIQAYSKGRNQGSLFVVRIPIKHENNQSSVR